MRITRRNFLRGASAATVLASSHVLSFASTRAWGANPSGRALVLINMSGGNDCLNTLIPMNDGTGSQRTLYDENRPDLGISPSDLTDTEVDVDPVLGFNQALHPQTTDLKALYDEGKLAILNGVGYPNHSLSHFDASKFWFAGQRPQGTGWLGRHLDEAVSPGTPHAISFGSSVNPSLASLQSDALGVNDITRFSLPDDPEGSFRDLDSRHPAWRSIFGDVRTPGAMAEAVARAGDTLLTKSEEFALIDVSEWGSNNNDVDGSLARQLRQVASILRHDQLNPGSETGLCFFHCRIGGFDTHSEQGTTNGNARHPRLMRELSQSMHAFQRDLEGLGLEQSVFTMTYSEFGRRFAQNDSGGNAGTDHGKAGLMFGMGDPSSLIGGIHGGMPDLLDPDKGNLRVHTDFRNIYASVIDQWLLGDHTQVLGGGFTPLSLFTPPAP